MRYVRIGDIYFNPMQINLIRPDVYRIDDRYVPNVEVWTDGREHSFEAADLGLEVPEFKAKWEAQGAADAMAAKVVTEIESALSKLW